MQVLLKAEGLSKSFRRGSGPIVRAVDDVSFELREGRTLSLIGESGSGKSTIGRMVLGLLPVDDGRVLLEGRELSAMRPRELRQLRSRMTVVFQEPFQSLNPQMRVETIIGEPLKLFRRSMSRTERRKRVSAALDEVGLNSGYLHRRPAELSGGQQQRVGVARAMIIEPRLIVLDEPTSSLDLTVRATILNLLKDLQARHDLAYLFISHDIASVRHFSDDIAVMYKGRFVETGSAAEVVDHPQHPYSKALLASTLSTDPRVKTHVDAATFTGGFDGPGVER